MEVFSPLDAIETEKIIKNISFSKKPAYVRLIRPSTPNLFNPKFNCEQLQQYAKKNDLYHYCFECLRDKKYLKGRFI
jgi:transketolase C-terminal domain/subunit